MLSNAYFLRIFLAKFRFDTAENEPAKNLQNFVEKFDCPRRDAVARPCLGRRYRAGGAEAAERDGAADPLSDPGPVRDLRHVLLYVYSTSKLERNFSISNLFLLSNCFLTFRKSFSENSATSK